MKANTRLLIGIFSLSVYLASCYPENKILGRYPNGNLNRCAILSDTTT